MTAAHSIASPHPTAQGLAGITPTTLCARDTQALGDVLAVLPQRQRDIARLCRLAGQAGRAGVPVVTVVGKYNHGKSRLLNEMLGRDGFAVADRRETVALATQTQDGVCWLDAPGLDADVAGSDDALAEQAIWLHSDIRLFVHAAKEGELDAAECGLLQQLQADAQRTRRQTVLVLSQVDQVASDAALQQVRGVLQAQLQDLSWQAGPMHAVSATRHRAGIEGGKRLLLEASGMLALRATLAVALAAVPEARRHAHQLLHAELLAECRAHAAAQALRLAELQAQQRQRQQAFDADLAAVLEKVQGDLHEVLDTDGADQALEPDSFENMFKVTAGKRARARLQVAYSRACIAIDGVLIQHGVSSLPLAQRTEVQSLNSVVVAVMGISVKFRDELRRMFFDAVGRARLQREFGRYFALSDEACALADQIDEQQREQAGIERALQALQAWEPQP